MSLEWWLRLDDLIIDRWCQPIIDQFGVEPREVSRFLLVGSAIGALVSFVLHGNRGDWQVGAMMLAPLPACMVWYWIPSGLPRSLLCATRLCLFALLVIGTPSAFFTLFAGVPAEGVSAIAENWLLVGALYFLSCRKPPPRRKVAYAERLTPQPSPVS